MFRGSHDAVEISSSQAEAAGAPRQARPQYRARNREERAAAAAPLAQMAPAPGLQPQGPGMPRSLMNMESVPTLQSCW
jgi:hypothetical protein